MSRRTRLKALPKEKFTLSHHFSYGASTTHFPRSYSMIGRDIRFPTTILPLCVGSKLCFVGNVGQFFSLLKSSEVNFCALKQASISLCGSKYQNSSPVLNFMTFSLSLVAFCFGYLQKTSAYREKLYPKYRFDDYQGLARIIRMFEGIDTLIINFQDNDIDVRKVQLLQETLLKSKIKKVVLRNLTYLMEVEGMSSFFQKLRRRKEMRFVFVWESFVLESDRPGLTQEEQRLNSISNEHL